MIERAPQFQLTLLLQGHLMHIGIKIVSAVCLGHDRVASVRAWWIAVAVLLLMSNVLLGREPFRFKAVRR